MDVPDARTGIEGIGTFNHATRPHIHILSP
jgi:hypothetical protein